MFWREPAATLPRVSPIFFAAGSMEAPADLGMEPLPDLNRFCMPQLLELQWRLERHIEQEQAAARYAGPADEAAADPADDVAAGMATRRSPSARGSSSRRRRRRTLDGVRDPEEPWMAPAVRLFAWLEVEAMFEEVSRAFAHAEVSVGPDAAQQLRAARSRLGEAATPAITARTVAVVYAWVRQLERRAALRASVGVSGGPAVDSLCHRLRDLLALRIVVSMDFPQNREEFQSLVVLAFGYYHKDEFSLVQLAYSKVMRKPDPDGARSFESGAAEVWCRDNLGEGG